MLVQFTENDYMDITEACLIEFKDNMAHVLFKNGKEKIINEEASKVLKFAMKPIEKETIAKLPEPKIIHN